MGKHGIAHQKKKFLATYATVGTVLHACQESGVNRASLYVWLKQDAEFLAAYEQAQEEVIESLEREAMIRAVDGRLEPVYQGGKKVGTIRKRSDVLLIFLLNGLKPDKYKKRHELTGPHGGPLQHVTTKKALTKDELRDELVRRGLPTTILKD